MLPFKKFKICSDFYIKGLKQTRGENTYIHPAYCIMNTNVVDFIDFAPNVIDGQTMDTGAFTYSLIKKMPKENVMLAEEIHRCEGSDSFHSIVDDCFFHFIRGSNWAGGKYHWNNQDVLTQEQFEKRKINVIKEFNKISEYKIEL